MTFDAWWKTLELAEQRRVEKAYAIEAFQAGASSRDAEVTSLINRRDYEFVRAENATMERDQLRTCLSRILNAIKVVEFDSEEVLDFDECTAMCVPMDAYYGLIEAAETFAATESK